MELEYPDDLRYLDSHEYVRLEGEIATIGVTAFALDELGDIVFLELPEVGDAIESGVSFGNIESTKATSELIAPVTGTVIESNMLMVESPEVIADDPYGEGWFIKVRVDDAAEIDDSLTAEQYEVLVEGM